MRLYHLRTTLLSKGLPKLVSGHGCHDGNRLFADGMDEADVSAQQRYAAIGIASRCPILQVALDGTADMRQLATYLVMPSCEQFYLDEVVTLGMIQHLIMQFSLLGVGHLLLIGVALILSFIAHDPMFEVALKGLRAICGDRPIGLVHLPFPKHLIQSREGLGCSCKNHQSRHRTIKTMYNPEKYVSRFVVLRLDIFFHRF